METLGTAPRARDRTEPEDREQAMDWSRGGRTRGPATLSRSAPASDSQRVPRLEAFEPRPINEVAARSQVDGLVARLVQGVDEATGGPLDNLINSLADMWVADVRKEYANYVARVLPMLDVNEAAVQRAAVMTRHDHNVLSHMVVALESALLRLTGRDQPGEPANADRLSARLAVPGDARVDEYLPVTLPGPEGQRDDHAGVRVTGHSDPPEPTSHSGRHDDELAPADVRILLGPRDRQRFAPWGDRSHSDPTLLAGRPISAYLHVVALVFAAGADVGAFYQIVQQVLRTESNLLVLVVVLGFTATVLYVAHESGALLRDRVAGARWIRGTWAYACVLIWLGLGVLAFWVRLSALRAATGPVAISLNGAHATGAESSSTRTEAALLFLALYVATGLVAGLGGYLSRNPLLSSYRTATKRYRQASERFAATTSQAHLAAASMNACKAQLRAAYQTCEYEVQARLAFAEVLKQYARVQVAERLKDPAATDAIFPEDKRPYVFPSHKTDNKPAGD
jgi:hypothetical protein